jgi:hypothetical protein
MAGCKCVEFVIGGMTEEELRADTEREMQAVRVSEAPETDRDRPPPSKDEDKT